MFNKEEQRRRAQQMSSSLQAQGLQAPKLVMPYIPPPSPKPAPVAVRKVSTISHNDAANNSLCIGDKVATVSYNTNTKMLIGVVIGFSREKIKIKLDLHGEEVSKYPKQVAKLALS
jgi:hypothetical protein